MASTTRTTRTSPSTSKPTWVIQLKSEGTRFPLMPKGALLTPKAVVPASGPWMEAMPSRT